MLFEKSLCPRTSLSFIHLSLRLILQTIHSHPSFPFWLLHPAILIQLNDMNSDQSSPSKQPITVAIAGGGIAGVCLALASLQHAPQIRIHIYEAAPKFQEVGAGVAIGINAQRALRKLDPRAGEAYARLATSNAHLNLCRGADGMRGDRQKATYLRLVMGMDHATHPECKAGKEVCEVFCEGGFSSVHRARFLDEMVALLPDDVRSRCVSFGRRVVGVEDICDGDQEKVTGVRLRFEDGSTATVDAVIGCDGIKSQIRRVLLGDAPEAHPTFTGKFAYRGLIPMPKAIEALGERFARNGHHHIGYGGHVLTFPIDHGNTLNVVAFRTTPDGQWCSDEWIRPATKHDITQDFADWGDRVQAILSLMERCDKWALFDHPPAHTYHKQGRICLIGDAAHASTPHQGSGAGMAIEDAYFLASLLGQVEERRDLERVFAAYEGTRKERTQRLVRCSREQAAIYDFQAPGVGDDVAKIAALLPRRWDWIWDYDVGDDLMAAQKTTGGR